MWNFNPATTFGYLKSLCSKSVCDANRPLVPRNPTKGARTDAATTALGGGGHRTEGHESRDMAHGAYCVGHGGPGHVSAHSPGLLVLEAGGARPQDGHEALEATPANRGPSGRREQERALHGLRASPHLFSQPKY